MSKQAVNGDRSKLSSILHNGAKQLGVELTVRSLGLLLDYLELLVTWNSIHNLVGPCTTEEMVARHFLDSLSVLPFLEGKYIVDLGTGAGFPGMVLAIGEELASRKFVLLESRLKKAEFVQLVITQLNLKNVEVIRCRAEAYQPEPLVDLVITRALASMPNFIKTAKHLCHKNGLFLAMKGKMSTILQEGVPNNFQIVKIQKIAVPGLDGERNLVWLKKK